MLLLALEVLRLVVTAEQEQDKIRDQYAYREVQLNFPNHIQKMNIDFKVRLGGGKQIHTFTNYRKFDAESTINFEEPK